MSSGISHEAYSRFFWKSEIWDFVLFLFRLKSSNYKLLCSILVEHQPIACMSQRVHDLFVPYLSLYITWVQLSCGQKRRNVFSRINYFFRIRRVGSQTVNKDADCTLVIKLRTKSLLQKALTPICKRCKQSLTSFCTYR